MAISILLDLEKCIACRGCQTACKEWNDLEASGTTQQGTYQNPPTLNPATYTLIEFIEHETPDGYFAWSFFNKRCLHCTDAACVNVCPTQALKQDQMGFVSLEQNLCNGCGYCAEACPFDVPQVSIKNVFTGEAISTKCTFCQDRVHNDLEPACSKACPTQAILFGNNRDELITLGEERVKSLQEKGLADARLYGKDELGGLRQMYVLPQSASFFGLPETPQLPFESNIQEGVRALGYVAAGATVLGLAFNWLTQRKRKLQISTDAVEEGES